MYNFYFGKIIMSIFEATMTLYIFEKYVHSMLLNYEDYRYCVVVLEDYRYCVVVLVLQ